MFLKQSLSAGAAALALLAAAPAAVAQEVRYRFDLPAQDLGDGLRALGNAANVQVAFRESDVVGKRSNAVHGDLTAGQAFSTILAGTGLAADLSPRGVYVVSAGPQAAGALVPDGATALEEIIVTAQRREQRIQDVPIAISAFTAETLNEQKIEGGVDLMRAIPNVAFTKTNFTSYNFQIRGLGTQAISATSDPGVAISFNHVGVIQNRLFEQEYFDIERVEVLRGPQGTLYGRNATAGVVNVISARPDLNDFEGMVKAEVGNFDSRRLVAMVNLPVIGDRLAVRFAGSTTQRDGYDYNSITDNAINGRDLWGARLSVGFAPTDRFRGDLIWEHFEENDNRSRTGKQLCHRDDGLSMIGSTPVSTDATDPHDSLARPAIFSTGCQAGSLYEDGAFETPNGMSLPFVLTTIYNSQFFPWGYLPDPNDPGQVMGVNLLELRDPFGGLMQSRDLREIASIRDPIYRAGADVVQLNLEFDLTDGLTLTSQTVHVKDSVYSFQDFNRFNALPHFRDTSEFQDGVYLSYRDVAPGGIFCDPQIGCSDRMAGFDISRSEAEQFSQEFRLASSFAGPVNFSVGANYTEFEALTEYFVMNNVLTALAMSVPFNGSGRADMCNITDFSPPQGPGGSPFPISMEDPGIFCPYIDPNPVESINGDGHNYFRSVNPYELRSTAAFGELYWDLTDALTLTAGLRYTQDRKTFTQVPTQLLLAPTIFAGGNVARGYPSAGETELEWGEWTGRLGLDWKPELGFTDHTLLYGFYSRGYKGGGVNPPTPDFATTQDLIDAGYIDQASADIYEPLGILPILRLNGLEYGATFEPEFVNAFEIGAKNTLLDGSLLFNATAFYYDYADYQVSQIRNRTAVNENFDATVWGAELETVWEPTPDLRINANLGYLRTRIADGETSIDIMNRNLGNPDYVVARSWVQIPANCVVPAAVAESWLQSNIMLVNYFALCGGLGGVLNLGGTRPIDPATGQPYDVANYPELNGGSGFHTDLSGNELPNAPRWTFNVGAQYGHDFGPDWRVTVRGDFYWQDQSLHRIYNYLPYDRLEGWTNTNLSIWAERGDGLRIEAYVKNVFDETPITGAFLNSDDAGLTTNVFTLDPRIIGVSIRQEF